MASLVISKICKGDRVRVVSGRESGKEGEVLRIFVNKKRVQKVIVAKLNMIKRCSKRTQATPQGGIIEREAGIHISNVMFLCTHCGKPTRLGSKVLPDGNRLRKCLQCGEVVERKTS